MVVVGGQIYEINTRHNNIDYTDGLPHDVIVRRSVDGRNVTMEITTEEADANRTKVLQHFNPYKPGVLFMGHRQTE